MTGAIFHNWRKCNPENAKGINLDTFIAVFHVERISYVRHFDAPKLSGKK